MTVTICIDRESAGKPGVHTNRWGKRLRSVRVWCGPIAIAWYAFNDYRLAVEPHEWSE
jgi:hypothetical protein